MTQTENPTKEELRKWTNAPTPPGDSTPPPPPTSKEPDQTEELLQPDEFDPKNERVGRPLAARPVVKAIAAAAILSPIVLVGFLFANGMPKAKLKPAPSASPPAPTEEPLSEADVLRKQLAEEKARVALLKQGQSRPIQSKVASPPTQTQPSAQRSRASTATPRRYSTVPAASIPVNRQPVAYSSRSYPQRIIPLRQYTPPTPAVAPRYQSTGRYTPPAPTIREGNATARVKTSPSITPSAPTQVEADPTQEWADLALLGSYGQTGSPTPTAQQQQPSTSVNSINPEVPSTNENITANQGELVAPVDSSATGDSQVAAGSQPLEATQGDRGTRSLAELPSNQTPGSEVQQNAPQIASNTLAVEESAILGGTTLKTLKPGSSTDAVLQTPLALPEQKETQTEDILIVRLKEPLFDKAGLVLYEPGTELLGRVVSSQDNGFVQAEVTAVLVGGIETPIPAGALLIRGKGGKPLVAERYRDKGGKNWGQIALGGISKAAEVLNRNTSISFSGGSSTTTVSENDNPDLLAGAVEGATDAWSQQITQRNDQTFQDAQDRSKLWFLEAGTAVEIFVNKPTVLAGQPANEQMDISGELPGLFSPLAPSDSAALVNQQIYSLGPTVLLPYEGGQVWE